MKARCDQRFGCALGSTAHLASKQQFGIAGKVLFYDVDKVAIGNHAHRFFVHDGYIQRAGRMGHFVFGHGAHVDIEALLIAVEELLGLRWVDGLYAHGVNLLSGK